MNTGTRKGLFFRRGRSDDATLAPAATTSATTSTPMATTPAGVSLATPAPITASTPVSSALPLVGGKISLTQPLRRAMQVNSAGTATIFANRRRTWRELGDRVARLAGALLHLGVQPDDRIAILSLNSDRYFESYLGVYWAGGAIVPMNIRWAVPEHIYSLNDSAATILIVDDAFHGLVSQIQVGAPTIKTVIFAGDGATPAGMLSYEAMLAAAEPTPDAGRGNHDLAGIFYTGGTTGFPKGVMLSHMALFTNGMATMHEGGYYGDSIYLHAAPMFHLADGAGSNAASIAGASHVFIPAFDAEKVIKVIAEQRVTHTLLVPSMIGMVMAHPALQETDLSSLHYLLYGASPISETLLATAIEKLPTCHFMQAFGQTELSPVATVLPPEYHVFSGAKSGKLRSAGRASYGVEVKIVDPAGQEVSHGTVGEVIVRGPNTMLGYWKKPEETAKTLVDGWVHTGDGAYMDDEGFIYVVDRLKDMIITGGENVYTTEVENAIASYPGVATSAVIGIPDERWGELVHAVVVLKPGAQVTPEALIAHCRTLIANYKCPRSISFQDALPLSGAGKVLKRELREQVRHSAQQ